MELVITTEYISTSSDKKPMPQDDPCDDWSGLPPPKPKEKP